VLRSDLNFLQVEFNIFIRMVKMKINCILLLISFASFSFISSEKSAFDCADNGLEKMDVAAANMLVLATQRKMPTSNQELETFCK